MSEQRYVYFIKPVGMDGPIKIGTSKLPKNRLLTLSVWSPFPLEIMGTSPGSSTEENRLHKRFSHLHTHGEWFLSSPALRGAIERILGGESIDEVCATLVERAPIRNQTRPMPTDDRKKFIWFGNRLRKAYWPLHDKEGRWWWPADVVAIMHNWRRDVVNNHLPIPPTHEQIERIEQVLAEPKLHGAYTPYKNIPRKAA